MSDNLSQILEYQTLDIQKRRTLDELEKSDDAVKTEQARNKYNKYKAVTADCESEAAVLLQFFAKEKAYFADTMARFNELEKNKDADADLDALTELIEQLAVLRNKLVELERKLNERKERGDNIINTYKAALEGGRKMRDYYKTAKQRMDEARKEKEPLINSIDAKLNTLRKTADAQFIALYDELAADKKLPAFVPLVSNDTCGGCGIQISQKTIASLKTGESRVVRCDTCRRVIYKK